MPVDPKLMVEQPDRSAVLQTSEDTAMAPAVEGEVSHAYRGRERRRSLRFCCSGHAEFRVEGSDVRMWGRLSDVSLHGCYVEMNNTFPVDTRVNLALEVQGIRAQMRAVVRVSYPFLGMGLCFSEVEPGQQLQLQQMLAALSGSGSTSSLEPSAASPATMPCVTDIDAAALLGRLSEFFSSNALLSRREFYKIARQSRR